MYRAVHRSNSAGQREDEPDGVISDLVNAIVGHVDDPESTSCGGQEIDVVEAGAVHTEDLDGGERRQHGLRDRSVLAEQRDGPGARRDHLSRGVTLGEVQLISGPSEDRLLDLNRRVVAVGDDDLAHTRSVRRLLGPAARSPDAFVTLLDFAYDAVHNGDLDSRDNVGLRAIYDWTREGVAFPALQRWILSGHDADLLRRMGYDAALPPTTKLRDRRGVLVHLGRNAREQLTSANLRLSHPRRSRFARPLGAFEDLARCLHRPQRAAAAPLARS